MENLGDPLVFAPAQLSHGQSVHLDNPVPSMLNRQSRVRRPFAFSCALFVALLASTASGSTAEPFHFDLTGSMPEADSHVASPSEIRLWFSEEPQEGATRIRLLDADGDLVDTGDVTQDPDEPTSFSIAVTGDLVTGMYTVAWRGMGADGHVVQGSFEFMVMGS